MTPTGRKVISVLDFCHCLLAAGASFRMHQVWGLRRWGRRRTKEYPRRTRKCGRKLCGMEEGVKNVAADKVKRRQIGSEWEGTALVEDTSLRVWEWDQREWLERHEEELQKGHSRRGSGASIKPSWSAALWQERKTGVRRGCRRFVGLLRSSTSRLTGRHLSL